MKNNFLRLPDPIPVGAILLGPQAWLEENQFPEKQVHCFSRPREVTDALKGQDSRAEQGTDDADGFSRLIFIHQDSFAGPRGGDRLVSWLEESQRASVSQLAVLLHADLPGHQLVKFFRAGLFDALNLPVRRPAWLNLLVRAEKRFELRKQSTLLLAESGETRGTLEEMFKEVGGQAVRNAGQLLKAQESLATANQQLTDAMRELSLLYKFGRQLSQAANWDGVLRDILQNLADYVQAGGAALILRSAPGGTYSPRKTWRWDESSWDKVLVNLQDQVDDAVAESMMAPGVFSVEEDDPDNDHPAGQRIMALPLEYQEIRLGFLLLLFVSPEDREQVSQRYLPFLQTVQVVLGEEIAGAQMLDRIRDIGAFNSRVLETVRSAIWVVNQEGQTVFCNRAGQEMLTGKPSQIALPDEFTFQLGRGRHQKEIPLYEELPELFLDARLQLDGVEGLVFARTRELASEDFRTEGRILGPHGEGIPVQVQTALMPGRSREESWLVIVAEDLRETRKLEAERRRREQLEGLVEMSATLAHEIRNPLMGLSAQAELLAEQLPAEDPKSRYIQVITGEVDRINDTISRMLNYVRPYAPQFEEINLVELCQDVKTLAEPRAAKKQLDMCLDFPASGMKMAWDALADGAQIKQVLLNLVINAIDAAPEAGRVQLALRFDQELEFLDAETGTRRRLPGHCLEVRDDGPGIPEEQLAKIFRPFFTTKNSGTGLGLSICQKIVVAHGGEIQVLRLDDQTVFRVLLPQQVVKGQEFSSQQEEA